MALTTEQLALINNLTYTADIKPIPSIYEYEGMTVRDYINDYLAVAGNVDSGREYSTFTDGQEWKQILKAIDNDPELCNMTIAATYNDTAMCDRGVVFTGPSASEAVVAFRGTGAKEWPDNFYGGGPTNAQDGVSTPQQEKALAWYREQYSNLNLEQYGMVTVTGHSKGGNKAQYITLEDSTVDRCESFDGQGFSDDYVSKKSELIALNGNKITNHSAEGDYVNILLNAVGEQKYYQANQGSVKSGGFAENHCPNTYLHFDQDGNAIMKDGTQMKEVQDIDRFLNSYLRTLSPEERAGTLQVIGELVEKGMDNQFDGLTTADVVTQYLNNGRYSQVLVPLVAYLILYQEQYPDTAESVKTILNNMGMDSFGDTIDTIVGYVTNDMVRELYKIDHQMFNNGVSKWLLNDMFESMGITSDEEKNIILSLIYAIFAARSEMNQIPDGNDIRIASIKTENSQMTTSPAYSTGSGNIDFTVILKNLADAETMLENEERNMLRLIETAGYVQRQLNGSLSVLRPALSAGRERLSIHRKGFQDMRTTLQQITREYQMAENRIAAG